MDGPITTMPQTRPNPAARMLKVLAGIGGLVLIAMMAHIVADVFMKYVFRSPIQGTLEIVSHYYMVMAVLLPLALVEWRRESISVDIFFQLFPRWLRLISVIFGLALMVTVYSGLTYQTIFDAFRAFGINEKAMGSAEIIIWPSRFAFPLGFAASALVCLWHLIFVLTGRDRDAWLAPHDDDHAPEVD